MRSGRPPRSIGVPGVVELTELAPGHWRALLRVRDATGRRRRVVRVSPVKFDSRGRKIPDRNGSRAEEAALAAAALIAPSAPAELSGATRVRALWQRYRVYLVEQGRADATLDLYDRWAELFGKAHGERQLIEVSTDLVEVFLRTVGEAHGRGSMLNARSMLSGMFRFAVRKGAMTVNPVREAELAKTVEAKGRTGGARQLDVEEVRFILVAVSSSVLPCPRLLSKKERERARPVKSYTPPTVAQYCDDADLADLVILFAAVGQRISQVLALGWSDIDLERRTARTTAKVVRRKGKGLVRVSIPNDPKNAGGTIALPDFAVEMLRSRRKALAARQLSAPKGTADEMFDLIFPSEKWTLRDPVNVAHEWQRARTALGIPEDVTGHSFRKAVATIIDDAGLSARVAADVLQHADPAMTQRRYMARGRVHHEAAEAVDRAIG